jgi:hypothetical protein
LKRSCNGESSVSEQWSGDLGFDMHGVENVWENTSRTRAVGGSTLVERGDFPGMP